MVPVLQILLLLCLSCFHKNDLDAAKLAINEAKRPVILAEKEQNMRENLYLHWQNILVLQSYLHYQLKELF